MMVVKSPVSWESGWHGELMLLSSSACFVLGFLQYWWRIRSFWWSQSPERCGWRVQESCTQTAITLAHVDKRNILIIPNLGHTAHLYFVAIKK